MKSLTRWKTGLEILSQPKVWASWQPKLRELAIDINRWLDTQCPDEIWLSGAGSSSFIGEAIANEISRTSGRTVRAVASTDLVGAPYEFFRTGVRPLVVSFGRSGNSSESVGVMDLLDNFCSEADRLNITCNPDSALAIRTGKGPGKGRVVLLPEAAHDQGFAMTVSYSSMLYTALFCLGGDDQLAKISTAAEAALAKPLSLYGLDEMPERLVFLGAGPLKAAAREASLKILELTKGRVASLWDSPLGFRHGPKSFINESTKVILFKSEHSLTIAYDDDLQGELQSQFGNGIVTSIGGTQSGADVILPMTSEDAWNVPICVIPAQIAGVVWADRLGLNVDDPFEGDGTLTRVVSGVTLYTDRVV